VGGSGFPFKAKGFFEHPSRYTPALEERETTGALTLESKTSSSQTKMEDIG